MKVVFRVDASLQMGIGHVMRCLALAQVLKENGANIKFICRKHGGNLIDKICSSGFNVHELGAFGELEVNNKLAHSNWLGATQQQDADDCIDILKVEKTDWLIVDHYALDEQWEKRLKPYYEKLMVIDDLTDRKHRSDIFLNQNLGSRKQDYQKNIPKDCQLLLGCKYALLRPEFSSLRGQALAKRKETKEVKNILISMGGSDINNISYDILRDIDCNYNTTVVLGKNSPHNVMIEDYAKGKNIEVVINANNMSELMLKADLAIGAGGSTSWERCCLGLPTLLFVTAENQMVIAKHLDQLGAVILVKNLKDDLQAITNNFYSWQSISKIASTICDGVGVKRVVKLLEN